MTALIQWKGTDVCADLICKCGWGGHFDGFHLYAFKCPDCGTVYRLPDKLQLKEIDATDLHYEWAVNPPSEG